MRDYTKDITYKGVDYTPAIPGLIESAEAILKEYTQKIQDEYGRLNVGSEYEFFVFGVEPEEEKEVLDLINHTFTTDPYKNQYGHYFKRFYTEFPLLRFNHNKSQGIHIPGVIKLELVIDHLALDYGPGHLVQKARALHEMMDIIDEKLKRNFNGRNVYIHAGPRPIPDIYSYLKLSPHKSEQAVLDGIKRQVEKLKGISPDLKNQIAKATCLEDLFLGELAPFDMLGAAGDGVDFNATIMSGTENLFNNDGDFPDIGSRLFWNATQGILEATHASMLPFASHIDSWERIGHGELSAPGSAQISQLKKTGSIIKKTWKEKASDGAIVRFDDFGAHDDNHMEVRHADPGHGRHGQVHSLIYWAATLAAMYHGMQADKVQSHEQLLGYKESLDQSFGAAVAGFDDSRMWYEMLRPDLHDKILQMAAFNARPENRYKWLQKAFAEKTKNGKYTIFHALRDDPHGPALDYING